MCLRSRELEFSPVKKTSQIPDFCLSALISCEKSSVLITKLVVIPDLGNLGGGGFTAEFVLSVRSRLEFPSSLWGYMVKCARYSSPCWLFRPHHPQKMWFLKDFWSPASYHDLPDETGVLQDVNLYLSSADTMNAIHHSQSSCASMWVLPRWRRLCPEL